eukprot:TRINITY_DN5705_c0_g2_i2.p1 TRINITY_DN5705_c0_g2~~TRINITY_DN5705_c0_g2_i2.p1  ORF type:complete len:581 (+),score=90.04 TRINITY_DN5705_c0_g2_i2:42-1784(+)
MPRMSGSTERCLGDMNITIGFKALALKGMKIASFEGLGSQTELEYMYLQNNCIKSFQYLGCQANLRELHLQNNSIRNFAGLTKQPKIEKVTLEGNPVSRHECYRLMALLCLGNSLRKIDKDPVTYAERDIIKRLPDSAVYAVLCGWLLDLKRRTHSEYMLLAEEYRHKLKLPASQVPAPPVIPITGIPEPHSSLGVGYGSRPSSSSVSPRGGVEHEVTPSISSFVSYEAQSSHRARGGYGKTPNDPQQPCAHGLDIANLRTALDEARANLVRERNRYQALLQDQYSGHSTKISEQGLTADELDCLTETSLGQGIRVNSTMCLSNKKPRSGVKSDETTIPSAFVTLGSSHISLAHFFNRIRVGEVAYREVEELKMDQPNCVLFLRMKEGKMLELIFEEEAKLLVMYKLVHYRLGMIPEEVVPVKPKPEVKRRNSAFKTVLIQHQAKESTKDEDESKEDEGEPPRSPTPPMVPHSSESEHDAPDPTPAPTTVQEQSPSPVPLSQPIARQKVSDVLDLPHGTPLSRHSSKTSMLSSGKPLQPSEEPKRAFSMSSGGTPKKESEASEIGVLKKKFKKKVSFRQR